MPIAPDPADNPPAQPDRPSADVDHRLDGVVRAADLDAVTEALADRRDDILGRWLAAARRQPFHRERPGRAVSDHIPALFDAVVAVLGRPGDDDRAAAPLDDATVTRAAEAHAQARFDQGLGPVAVITEFRLLRQEIGRALADQLDDEVDAADVVAGMTLVGDALDGAATVGLTALSDRIETLRESFLATTLHDIRQPITLVEGSLRLADRWLRTPAPDAGRLAEAVRDALLATSELTMIIDTLSDASRVAMGALELELEPASLDHIVREAVAALGEQGRDRVHVDVAPASHLIGLWDPRLLHRLVANLLSNALKYSPPDRPVDVRLESADGPAVRLRIRDNGIGMTGDELDRVFERFVRAERARRAGTGGLGLGLYACRGIVTAHGGTIVVESDGHDRGTSVTVTLPTHADALADVDA